MSHFLNRSKVSNAPVAGDALSKVGVQAGLLQRVQAQIHQPRTRVLKPPTS
jgi:hypothetical protein